MRKFTYLITKIALSAFLILFGLNVVYRQTNRYQNLNYEIVKFQHVPEHLTFANFGSSHGQLGFYYNSELKVKAFNFALSSQTPFYDLELLKSYLGHFDKGATLVFPISYFTPYLFERELDTEFETRNIRYYNFLPNSNILEFKWLDSIKSRLKMLQGKNLVNLWNVIQDVELLPELKKEYGNFPMPQWSNPVIATDQEMMDIANDRWTYWGQYRAHLPMDGSSHVNQSLVDTYMEIIRICNENDLNAVFVTLPVSNSLNIVTGSEFYDIFKKDVSEIMTELGNPVYIDFSHDDISFDQDNFIDSDHLSQYGATKLTRNLMSLLSLD